MNIALHRPGPCHARRVTFAGVAMTVAAAGVGMAALPGTAGTWTPPAGCSAVMTVQAQDCRVENHFTCEADPEGYRRRADFGPLGNRHTSVIDGQTQWIEMHDLENGQWVESRLVHPVPDRGSVDVLLEQGHDSYRFDFQSTNGERLSYRGFDALSGESVTVSGIELQVTSFGYEVLDRAGTVLRRFEGQGHVSADMKMFFGGAGQGILSDGMSFTFDSSPLAFVWPGQPGFLETEPRYGCAGVVSDAVFVPGAGP